MRRTVRFAIGFLALGTSVLAQTSRAQQDEPVPGLTNIPFQKWVAEPEHKEIPWRVIVFPPGLRLHQRLTVRVDVHVPGKGLERLGPVHDLVTVMRLADSDGHWLERNGMAWARVNRPLPRGAELGISLQAVVVPGEYTLGLVLYDAVSGRHSATSRPLHVPPLRNDPLPNAFRDLPRVEFPTPPGSTNPFVATAVPSRLWLPVTSRRPLRLDVLVNFSPSDQFTGSERLDRFNVGAMLTLLSVLAQLNVRNGTLHVTGLDLARRRVVFEQHAVVDLDWNRLITTLREANANVVSVQTLEGRKQNAAFFREVLAGKLAEAGPMGAGPDSIGAGATSGDRDAGELERPRCAFIVVSSAMLFPRGADLAPLPRVALADTRIFHLRYQLGPSNLWDELHRILKPLEPRTFSINDPMDLRRALARIIGELSSL